MRDYEEIDRKLDKLIELMERTTTMMAIIIGIAVAIAIGQVMWQ